jgi:hypothetical protein
LVAQVEDASASSAVAVADGVAYVGWPVAAYDVADPANPRLLGRRSLVYSIYGAQLATAGGVAYVAGSTGDNANNVLRVDARGPESGPTQTGLHADQDWILGFDVEGDRAFATGDTLRVFDLSVPGDPPVLDQVAMPDTTLWDVAVGGSTVYAVAQKPAVTNSLVTFAVGADGSLTELGSLEGFEVSSIVAGDGYVYGARWGTEGEPYDLLVVDTRDPSRPQLVSSTPLGGRASVLRLDGHRLYVGPDPFEIYDVSDPGHPRRLGSLTGLSFSSMHVTAGRAFVASNAERPIRVIDVSDPTDPRDAGVSSFAPGTTAVDGSASLLVAAGRGVHLFDVSDPDSPVDLGSAGISGEPTGAGTKDRLEEVRVSGNRIVGEIGGMSLIAYNCSSPEPYGVATVLDGWPSEPATFDGDVAIHQPLAIVAAGDDGLRTVDVSVPSQPAEIGRLASPGWKASRLELAWPLAMVDAGRDGLRVIDVGNPRRLKERGVYEPVGREPDQWTMNSFSGVAVAGDTAYVAVSQSRRGSPSLGGRLEVVSLADPDHPTLLSQASLEVPSGRSLTGVAVSAGRAYVLAWDWLAIFDVTDPLAPRQLGAAFGGGSMTDIRIDGHYAYVVGLDAFRVLDVENPSAIQVAAAQPIANPASETARLRLGRAAGRLVAAVTWPGGVQLFDLRDPTAPRPVGAFAGRSGWRYSGAWLEGARLYVATGGAGLNVLWADELASWPWVRAFLPMAGS